MNEHEEVTVVPGLDDQARRVGISLAELARRSGIHAWRIYGGYVNADERKLLDAVLAEAERKRNRWRDPAYV